MNAPMCYSVIALEINKSYIVYLRYYLPSTGQPARWLSGLRRSHVHSLMIVRHCALRIPVRAVRGLISRAGMVSICPLL